jgi:hypothetical protein
VRTFLSRCEWSNKNALLFFNYCPPYNKTFRSHYTLYCSNAVLHFQILTCWYLHKGEKEKASETWHLRRHLPFSFLILYISLSSRCTTAYKAYCVTLNPPPGLDVPTSATRCLHVHKTREILAVKDGIVSENVGR